MSPQNNIWPTQPIIIEHQQSQTSSENPQASKIRFGMAMTIIFLGFISLILGIATVTTAYDFVGWGIWGGLVSI